MTLRYDRITRPRFNMRITQALICCYLCACESQTTVLDMSEAGSVPPGLLSSTPLPEGPSGGVGMPSSGNPMNSGGEVAQGGAESGGVESGGAESGGAESGGAESGGAESGGAELGGEELGGEELGGEELGGEELGGEELGGEDMLTPLCEPFERVGLCGECDEDGELFVPEFDAECPIAECPESYYELDAEGRCIRQTLSPSEEGGLCESLELCLPPEDQLCLILDEEVIAGGDTCQEIISCEGPEPPEVSNRPDGALCNEWGTCQEGACNVPEACSLFERYNTQNFFCDADELDSGETGCIFFVDGTGANNDGSLTCDDFCALSGTLCVDGWNNNGNTCGVGNGDDGCDVPYNTQICVCAVP